MYVWNAQGAKAAAVRQTRHHRFVIVAGATIFAAIALSTATASLNVDFTAPTTGVEAGLPWEANLHVKRAGLPVENARPVVTISDGSGITRFYQARPGAKPGTYRVKIILPDGGNWTYEVMVGSRVYERGTVVASAPPSLPEGI